MISRMVQTGLLIGAAFLLSSLLYWQVEAINRGGPVMILILMCSIFALAITIERLYYLLSEASQSAEWLDRLRVALTGDRWDEAHSLCQTTRGPIARVIGVGLSASSKNPQAIERAMEEAAMSELPHVEKHLRWLSTIAQVATLLGLLGTVTGMVRCFRIIQEKSTGTNPVNPGDLAGGIWEALLTTVAGLTVAIPTIVAYNYLANRATEVRAHLERAATLVVGWISQPSPHATAQKKSA